ncbi:hypothetical protein GCM10028785_29560 [Hydrogenophaga soli]
MGGQSTQLPGGVQHVEQDEADVVGLGLVDHDYSFFDSCLRFQKKRQVAFFLETLHTPTGLASEAGATGGALIAGAARRTACGLAHPVRLVL